MFDRSIIETDNFLNVSLTAKALYFLLGMEADDEGFVSPARVCRLYGGEMGDVKNLIDTGLVIPFRSGVVVITDWNQNNWLDQRRIKPTRYQDEKAMISLTHDRRYVLSNGLADAKREEYRVEENSIEEKSIYTSAQTSKKLYGELQKVRLSDDEYQKLIERLGETNAHILISELDTYIASKGKKYQSHYATILSWAQRRYKEHLERTNPTYQQARKGKGLIK